MARRMRFVAVTPSFTPFLPFFTLRHRVVSGWTASLTWRLFWRPRGRHSRTSWARCTACPGTRCVFIFFFELFVFSVVISRPGETHQSINGVNCPAGWCRLSRGPRTHCQRAKWVYLLVIRMMCMIQRSLAKTVIRVSFYELIFWRCIYVCMYNTRGYDAGAHTAVSGDALMKNTPFFFICVVSRWDAVYCSKSSTSAPTDPRRATPGGSPAKMMLCRLSSWRPSRTCR